MEKKPSKFEAAEHLDRHRRKCTVCHHPHRQAIEEDFLHWRKVRRISDQYKLADPRPIYRHARATGLNQIRRENVLAALDQIVERASEAKVTVDSVIRAMRAHSCLDERGRWTDPPTRVVFNTSGAAAVGAPSLDTDATPVVLIPVPGLEVPLSDSKHEPVAQSNRLKTTPSGIMMYCTPRCTGHLVPYSHRIDSCTLKTLSCGIDICEEVLPLSESGFQLWHDDGFVHLGLSP
jgi:hypothetical protein